MAFCLTETGLVRPQIGEAFAFDAFQRLDPALFVADLAIVIAEIKLSQRAMQMSFAAMLVDAPHAALEDRKARSPAKQAEKARDRNANGS